MKEVRELALMLDDIVKEYKEEHPPKKRNWRTYEQRVAERLRTAFRELRAYLVRCCLNELLTGIAVGCFDEN